MLKIFKYIIYLFTLFCLGYTVFIFLNGNGKQILSMCLNSVAMFVNSVTFTILSR